MYVYIWNPNEAKLLVNVFFSPVTAILHPCFKNFRASRRFTFNSVTDILHAWFKFFSSLNRYSVSIPLEWHCLLACECIFQCCHWYFNSLLQNFLCFMKIQFQSFYWHFTQMVQNFSVLHTCWSFQQETKFDLKVYLFSMQNFSSECLALCACFISFHFLGILLI